MPTLEEENSDGLQDYANWWPEEPFAPVRAGPFVLGAIYEVNGEGAVEHTTTVTTFEIETLCKHWASRLLSFHFEWRVYGQTGSRDIREGPYADARLHHFAGLLGREKVDAIVAEIYSDVDFDQAREDFEACIAEQGDPSGEGPSPDESGEDSLQP